MGRVGLLCVLWIWSIIGLASAREVINCLDGNKCTDVHAVVQGPQDVAAVMRSHANSRNVDFHGNLLSQFIDSYTRNVRVQWEKLNLSYNLLDDDFFVNLQSPKLKYVDITYNLLTTVTVPSSVVEFIAERNNLTSITISSRILERLILPKNKLDSLRQFKNLPRLTELDLSCNQLEKLNLDELSSMPSLTSLNMANNRIHIVEGNRQFASLQYLDLSSNLLTMVDEPFASFPIIKHLYLQNNKIVMWVKEFPVPRSLQIINIHNNDWECGNVNTLKQKFANKIVQGSENVACTPADSPYADRVIKYRKQEFYALKTGAAQRDGNISCESYKPNPCDGDDNRVYEVARSAMNSVENFAKQSMQQLQGELVRQHNYITSIQQQIVTEQQKYDQLNRENSDLVNYIDNEYKDAGLSGKSDAATQLNEIFEHYERENAKLKSEIKAEELRNADKLNELTTVENDIEDLEYQKNNLLKELDQRNSTVMGYQAKIDELNKKLQKVAPS
uniref:Protein phosphatase 1 regulatory subunit n=1 Tax=Aedes albopictus TaxID=7160 RepID=A0A023EW19_AEDAL